MTAPRSADDFLADIVAWSERSQRHIMGMTSADFLENELVRDAVGRCIEVIGESAHKASQLDPSLEKNLPEFRVDRAYGARNVIAHGYNNVEPAIVWTTVTTSIPEFVAIARRILAIRKAPHP